MLGFSSRAKARTRSESTSVIRLRRFSTFALCLRNAVSGTRSVSSATTESAKASTSLVLSNLSIGALAPLSPHVAISSLEVARTLGLVHDGRILHALAQPRSDCREAYAIRGFCRGERRVFVGARGDP